jgi:hypothetical protein
VGLLGCGFFFTDDLLVQAVAEILHAPVDLTFVDPFVEFALPGPRVVLHHLDCVNIHGFSFTEIYFLEVPGLKPCWAIHPLGFRFILVNIALTRIINIFN